jgi:ATP-binding cassette subfamily A (ABC1) protein 3
MIFVIETRKGKIKPDSQDETLIHHEKQEDEVLKEIEEGKNNNDYTIKVQNMSKVYTMISSDESKCCSCKKGTGDKKKGGIIEKKVAVKGISFGVKKGDCFGLLGTNGAGKTTTFKILSGEIQPTSGMCLINGMNVATDMKEIRNLIGYCPQFDALLNNLTTREHLELYAAIKGIPVNMREKLISEKIVQLNLSKYEHVQAGTYSGGNKRKLSVAIALLGNPPIVFLDEPSSGMDPEARRFMWSVVSRVTSGSKKSSVVLTTHSMEEAEALSTKLAIMVEGNVKCIGPVQALKNKYGKGFEIETKFRE